MSEIKKLMAAHHEKLLAACVEYRAKLDELERENAALRKDKERLDWLDSYISTDDTNQLFPKIKRADCHSIREAIDAARKEEKP